MCGTGAAIIVHSFKLIICLIDIGLPWPAVRQINISYLFSPASVKFMRIIIETARGIINIKNVCENIFPFVLL